MRAGLDPRILSDFQHFEIPESITSLAIEGLIEDRFAYEKDDVSFIVELEPPLMPADKITLSFQRKLLPDLGLVSLVRNGNEYLLHAFLEDDEQIQILAKPGRPLGEWVAASLKPFSIYKDDSLATLYSILNFVLRLISDPKLTVRTPSGSRQSRRAALRKHGTPVESWKRVEWNIGTPSKKGEKHGEGERMPLHFRRGYFRRAKPGETGAHLRLSRTTGRIHWLRWIEGYWAGHPAFGIRRSVHAPKLPVLKSREPLAA